MAAVRTASLTITHMRIHRLKLEQTLGMNWLEWQQFIYSLTPEERAKAIVARAQFRIKMKELRKRAVRLEKELRKMERQDKWRNNPGWLLKHRQAGSVPSVPKGEVSDVRRPWWRRWFRG